MAGGKETPGQKMIGMMYLVLIALLALNVSKEIINAFVKLDTNLLEGNLILVNRNEGIMHEFDKARATEMLGKVSEKESEVIKWRKVAEEIRKSAFELDRFIQLDCKSRMLKEVEGRDFIQIDEKNQRFQFTNLHEVETKDEYDVPSRLFGGEPGTDGFKFGAEIRSRIHQFRDEVCQKTAAYEYEGRKYSFYPRK